MVKFKCLSCGCTKGEREEYSYFVEWRCNKCGAIAEVYGSRKERDDRREEGEFTAKCLAEESIGQSLKAKRLDMLSRILSMMGETNGDDDE